MSKFGLRALFITTLIASTSTYALDNLTFKGNLVIPNCIVNGNQAIETNFNNIEIQTLASPNTGYHWKSLTIPVNCPYTLGMPKIKLSGNKAVQENSLKTSKYDMEKLVVYFKQGTAANPGSPITLGGYNNLTGTSVTGTGNSRNVLITAGIGREGGMELLKPGPFTASANMEIRYE
ncbi:fimbrial protein [Escherichia coli]|uniref:fimbrial protein n=1 Tax=Escherichia coli TaxID=562 RepID=UPI000BE8DB99|nr:fimbrial protein [Escherichia coli]MBB8471305.1 fimbrial protein [Escherichia coli]